MTVACVSLPIAADTAFDYWVPAGLAVERGSLVRVRLGRRPLVGVVVDIADATDVSREKLQPIAAVLGGMPALSGDLLDLGRFVSDYYQEPLGRVLAQMLPPFGAGDAGVAGRTRTVPAAYRLTEEGRNALSGELARAPRARALYEQWRNAPDWLLTAEATALLPPHLKRTLRRWRDAGWAEDVAVPLPFSPDASAAGSVLLNAEQRSAVAAIDAAHDRFAPFLLEGVTGSGKTEVYLAAAAACIARGRQALLLVPEINLTPQFAQRIAATLPGRRTVTLHSRLAAGERRRHWRQPPTARPTSCSARGLPCSRRCRGSASSSSTKSTIRRSSSRRASVTTAAMSRSGGRDSVACRSCWAAQRHRWRRSCMRSEAATACSRYRNARWRRRGFRGLRFFPCREGAAADGVGERLLAAIEMRLARGEQSLVFINRRGFAPSLLCAACGWQAGCTRCSARLVVHRDAGALALPSLRLRRDASARMSRMRQCRPPASGPRHAAAGARAGRCGFLPRGSRESIATARAASARSQRCATRSKQASSTSSSARRCWPRATTSRA